MQLITSCFSPWRLSRAPAEGKKCELHVLRPLHDLYGSITFVRREGLRGDFRGGLEDLKGDFMKGDLREGLKGGLKGSLKGLMGGLLGALEGLKGA